MDASNLRNKSNDVDEEMDLLAPLLKEPSRYEPVALPEKAKITPHLVLGIVACTIGSSFMFGYNIGVMNTPDATIRRWINDCYKRHDSFHRDMLKSEETFIWSTAVSIFSIGGMIGGLLSGNAANQFGRRGAMQLNALLSIVASFIQWSAYTRDSYYLLIVGRVIAGLNAGLSSGIAPMYLTEIAPNEYRGAVGSLNQLVITIAIFVAQILGLEYVLGQDDIWQYLFLVSVIPALLQLALFMCAVESPPFFLMIGHESLAHKQLEKLRCDSALVESEFAALHASAVEARNRGTISWHTIFADHTLRWALFISVIMMLSQQLSGINSVILFSSDIFRTAGLSSTDSQWATIGTGALNILITFVSVLLIERFGRRILHMTGMTIMLCSSILLVISMTLQVHGADWASFLSIIWVMTFVLGFATGPGSIPWFYVSELFDPSARGHANSIAVAVNWLASYCVGQFFLPLKNVANQYAMLVFTFFLTNILVFTFFFVPETKNRSVNELQKLLRAKKT